MKKITLNPPEKTRTYLFPQCEALTLTAVSEVIVSDSGHHRVKAAGKLYLVSPKWLAIEIEAAEWQA